MATETINVLVVGGGGREHAIGWKIASSPLCGKVYFAPGNAGTAAVGENLPIGVKDFDALKAACLERRVQVMVVGPEDPLCMGIHDAFAQDETTKHIVVVGPKKDGAKLEGSKAFSKSFMEKHSVPTAKYRSFNASNISGADEFLESLKPPYVLKSDGLAAGKGVLIIDNLDEAKKELSDMIVKEKFGPASASVVVEEYLDGQELSVFALIDSAGNFKILPTSVDFKRAGDGDTGLNTGGMGAVSPCPYCTEDSEFLNKVVEKVVKPTVQGALKDGLGYTGFLYVGLMKVGDEPYVIEYNCRMGDPETEVVMTRIASDLIPLLLAIPAGGLNSLPLDIAPHHSTTVVVVSGGYPGSYPKGKEISGLTAVDEDCVVFHAGTKEEGKKVVTSGGRVLAVTCKGDTLKEATEKAYLNTKKISFEGHFYRSDIAKKLM